MKKFIQLLRNVGGAAHEDKSSTSESTTTPTAKTSGGTSFKDLGLIEPVCRAVIDEGYENPTPIQLAAIPYVMEGRDLLGCAQTGTGKTAAFALPILHRLASSKTEARGIRALILTPTRELAIQVADSFKTYGKHLRLKTGVVFGGVGIEPQKRMLKQGPDIIVATPGRLIDLNNQGFGDFRSLEIFVLDEADRMLDMGFFPDVKRIISALPKTKQNLLFSATMPPDIQELTRSLLKNPAKVEVTPISSTSELIAQQVYFVDRMKKRDLLLHLLKTAGVKRALIFTRTKNTANRVADFLCREQVKAEAIHGNKSQNARQRALENFRDGSTRILVASDIAARGIDIDEISHVINYDVPNVPETYVHRIGRTGRAEARGAAISLVDAEEHGYLRDIEKLIRQKVPVVSAHPFPAQEEERAPAPQGRGQGRGGQQGRGGRSGQGRGGGQGHRGQGGGGRGRGSSSSSSSSGRSGNSHRGSRRPADS